MPKKTCFYQIKTRCFLHLKILKARFKRAFLLVINQVSAHDGALDRNVVVKDDYIGLFALYQAPRPIGNTHDPGRC
ncbi:hypothetical protein D3C86_2024260 [compost metagenome]